MGRYHHKSNAALVIYTGAEEEVKMALAAGIPRATMLTYFYPEVTVERMSSYRKKQ